MKKDITNATAIEIIENLKSLKGSDLDEELKDDFIENLYYLLRASAIVFLEFSDNSVKVSNSKNIEKVFELAKQDIIALSSNALKMGFAYEKFRHQIDGVAKPMGVAFRLHTSDESSKVVFFVYDFVDKNDLNNQIIKTQFVNDFLLLKPSTIHHNDTPNDLQYILNLSSDIINIKDFKLACNSVVNDIASKFDFDKVSLATFDDNKTKLISISHTSEFEKNNKEYDRAISLFEESIYQDEDIVMIDLDEPSYIIDEHKSYYTQKNLTTLITLPIRHQESIIGAITAYSKSKEIEEKDILLFRLAINKIAPILHNIKNSDKSLKEYLNHKKDEILQKFVSPENALFKSIVATVCVVLVYVLFFSYKYEVSATAILNTNNSASISTPLNGIIDNIYVKVGDKVEKNQKLFSLDTQELKLKELETKADIVRYQKEQENSMAQRKLADMEIAQAKVQQAKSKLKRIQYNINTSTIKSTISGTVVQGDKEKLLRMPISKGDTVFYISNSNELFLEIKVPESDIYHIKEGQKGKMILLSDPQKEHNFVVDKIIPQAETDSTNGNVYIVYGTLDTLSKEWWHPGMSGVVKIDTGDKNIFWILTHKISDFFRIYFW
jgi:RND family efflux transporter MFP subunit